MSVGFTVTYSVFLIEHPNETDVVAMRFVWNVGLLRHLWVFSAAVSPLTVPIPPATTVLDNKESILPSVTDGNTLVSFWRGSVEHVLLNGVTREAAVAGQREQAGCWESPAHSQKTQTMWPWIFFPTYFSLISPFSILPLGRIDLLRSPFVLNVCRISLPCRSHLSTINKATWSFFFLQEIHNELCLHSYNPFKHAAGRQWLVPAGMSDNHPATWRVYHSLLPWIIVSPGMIPWQQALLNVCIG